MLKASFTNPAGEQQITMRIHQPSIVLLCHQSCCQMRHFRAASDKPNCNSEYCCNFE